MGDRAGSALVEALQAGGVVPLPRTNAGQFDVERGMLGAPWVPARAAEASTPWRQRMDTGPVRAPGPPAFVFPDDALLAGARTEAAATDT